MLWFPGASDEMLSVGLLTGTVPKVVFPSRSVIVPVGPVGVPDPGATTVTVAVRVMVWPKLEGLGDAINAVVVVAGFTV